MLPSCNPGYIKVPGQISQVKRTVRVQGNGVNVFTAVNISRTEIEIRVVVQIQAGEMVIPKPQFSQVLTAAYVQHG